MNVKVFRLLINPISYSIALFEHHSCESCRFHSNKNGSQNKLKPGKKRTCCSDLHCIREVQHLAFLVLKTSRDGAVTTLL